MSKRNNKMDIETTILKIISKVSSSGISDIRLQSYFIRDLDFTALEFAEMLNFMEEELNIKFSANDELNMNTVEELNKIAEQRGVRAFV